MLGRSEQALSQLGMSSRLCPVHTGTFCNITRSTCSSDTMWVHKLHVRKAQIVSAPCSFYNILVDTSLCCCCSQAWHGLAEGPSAAS